MARRKEKAEKKPKKEKPKKEKPKKEPKPKKEKKAKAPKEPKVKKPKAPKVKKPSGPKTAANIYTVMMFAALAALGTLVGILWYTNIQLTGESDPFKFVG